MIDLTPLAPSLRGAVVSRLRRKDPAQWRACVAWAHDGARTLADVAAHLGVSVGTLKTWRREDPALRALGLTAPARAEQPATHAITWTHDDLVGATLRLAARSDRQAAHIAGRECDRLGDGWRVRVVRLADGAVRERRAHDLWPRAWEPPAPAPTRRRGTPSSARGSSARPDRARPSAASQGNRHAEYACFQAYRKKTTRGY